MESGVNADIIVCRTEKTITDELRSKIALFCNVDVNSVIESIDAKTIYEVPLLMQNEKLDQVVLNKLNISKLKKSDLSDCKSFVNKIKNPKTKLKIGLIG